MARQYKFTTAVNKVRKNNNDSGISSFDEAVESIRANRQRTNYLTELDRENRHKAFEESQRQARLRAIELAKTSTSSANAGDNRTTEYNKPKTMSVYGGLGTLPNPATQGMNTSANGADIDYSKVNENASKGWKGISVLNGTKAKDKTISQEESLAHATEVMKPYTKNAKAMEILNRYSELEDSQDRSGMLNFQSIGAYSGQFDKLANDFINETGVSMDEFRKIAENYSYIKHSDERNAAKAKKKEQNAAVNIAQGIGEAAISPLTNYQAMIGAMQNPTDEELGRDYNSPFMKHLNAQEDTKEAFEAKTESLSPVAKTLANLGYDLTVTGTQSAAAALTGQVGLGSFAAGGYSQTLQESDERGLSEGQAQVYSAISGGLEYITERLPIEHLKKIYNGNIGKSAAGSLKPYIKAALEQMGEEASEELVNGIADTITDGLINGDKSRVNAAIRSNINNGMSEEEATKSAYLDIVKDTGYSMLVAALSTGVSAGPALAGQARASAKAGRNIADYENKTGNLTRNVENEAYIPENREAYVADEDYNQAQSTREAILAAAEKVANNQRISGKEARAITEQYDTTRRNISQAEAVRAQQIFEGAKAKSEEKVVEQINKASTPAEVETIKEEHIESEAIKEAAEAKKTEMIEAGKATEQDFAEAITPTKAQAMAEKGEVIEQETLEQLPKKVQKAYELGSAEQANKLTSDVTKTDISTISYTDKEGKSAYSDIKNVSQNNSGEIVFELESGETVKAAEAKYTTKGDKLYNSPNGINSLDNPTLVQLAIDIEKNSKHGVAVGTVTNALKDMYTLGAAGLSFEQGIKSRKYDLKVLGEDKLRVAFEEGKKNSDVRSRSTYAAKGQGLIKESTEENKEAYENQFVKAVKKSDDRTIYVHDEQAMKEYEDNLSQNNKNFLEAFSKKIGVDIAFIYDTNTANRGQYVPEQGRIYLNLAYSHNMFNVALHEGIGEFLAASNEKAYNQIVDSVLNAYAATNSSKLASDIRAYQKAYAGDKYGDSARGASYELFNDALSDIFGTEENMKKLFDWMVTNEGEQQTTKVKKTLTDYFKNVIDSIKDIKRNGLFSKRVDKQMELAENEASKYVDQILKAVDEAIANRDAGKTEAETSNRNSKRNSFGGIRAKNSNMHTLTEAQDMLADGKSMSDIFYKTGWYKGADGKWRFEISNNDAELFFNGAAKLADTEEYKKYLKDIEYINTAEVDEKWMKAYEDSFNFNKEHNLNKDEYRLDEILKNDKLFEGYPTLAKMKVTFKKLPVGTKGQYNPATNDIILNKDMQGANTVREKRTLFHELQHAIQYIEDFAFGSSPEYWERKGLPRYYDEEEKRKYNAAVDELESIEKEAPEDFLERYQNYKNLLARYGGLIENEDLYSMAQDIEAELREENEELFDKLDDASFNVDVLSPEQKELTANEAYYATAGEIEARDVSDRLNLSEEEARNTLPKTTDDEGRVVFSENPLFPWSYPDSRFSKKVDEAYDIAVEENNTELMEKLVETAAVNAGFDSTKLYHGTDNFGFTSFDKEKLDDKNSIFVAEDLKVASSYTYADSKPKQIKSSFKDNLWDLPDEKVWELYNNIFKTTYRTPTEEEFNDDINWQQKKLKPAITRLNNILKENDFEDSDKQVFKEAIANLKIMSETHSKEDFRDAYSIFNYAKWNFLDEDAADIFRNSVTEDELEAISYIYQRIGIERKFFVTKNGVEIDWTNALIDKLERHLKHGIYQLYGKSENPYEIDAAGANWDKVKASEDMIKAGYGEYVRTRDISEYARLNGYDSVRILNVKDSGGKTEGVHYPTNVRIYFNSHQLKSADPITYDDAGNIIPLSERFNSEDEDLRKSIKIDSNGRSLSKEQQEYFKDSKVVDEAGRLRVVYHGTMADFNIFDLKEARDTEDIEAFFFSGDYEESSGYGNVGEYYLNITNPADYDTAYDIFFKHKGKEHAGRLAREELQSMGYDGVIAVDEASPEYTEYLVFDSNQIKRVDNKKPTESADIRYSIKIDDDQVYIHRGIEIVKNPTNSQYKQMREDILEERPWLRGTDEPLLRHTYDEDGNVYYWEALKAMHRDVEPAIRKHWNTRVAQNYEWWKDQDKYFWPTYYEERYSKDVFGESSPYSETLQQTEYVSQVLSTLNNQLKGTSVSVKYIEDTVKYILDKYKSNVSEEDLTHQLMEFIAYMTTEDRVDYKQMMNYLMNIGDDIIRASELKDPESERVYGELKKELSSHKINLTEVERKELIAKFGGSWNAVFGKLNQVGIKLDSKTGQRMDAGIYEDIANKFREIAGVYLDESKTPVDQIATIIDAMDALSPTAYEWDGATDMDKALDVATTIIDRYYSMATSIKEANIVKGTEKGAAAVERAKKTEIKKLRAKQAEWKEKLNADFAALVEDKKKMVAEQQEFYRKQAEAEKKFRGEKRKFNQKMNMSEKELQRTAKVMAKMEYQGLKDTEAKRKNKDNIVRTCMRLINWMNKPTEAKHVPTFLKPALSDMIKSIDFMPASMRKGEDGTISAQKWQTSMRKLQQVLASMNAQSMDSMDDSDKYNLALVLDAEDIVVKMEELLNKYNGTADISKMSKEDLKKLSDIMTNISTGISKMNENFMNRRFKHVSDAAVASMDEMDSLKPISDDMNVAKSKAADLLNLDMLDPYSFFHELGDAAKSIMQEFYDGEKIGVEIIREAEGFFDNLVASLNITQKDLRAWENDRKEYHYDGGTITLTPAEIMSLYCSYNREMLDQQERPFEATHHIMSGGIKGHERKVGVGPKATIVNRNPKVLHLTEGEILELINTLTTEQIAYADQVVEYMSTTLAAHGNETSNKISGFSKFLGSKYFPLKTDSNTIKTNESNSETSLAGLMSLIHQSFTKSQLDKADNALVLMNFFDVVTEHVTGMSNYCAYAMPLSDALRWYNFSETERNNTNVEDVYWRKTRTVKESMEKVKGKGAKNYFENFLRDVNLDPANKGGSKFVANAARVLTGLGRAKAIALNISVWVQQPTAIVRASDVIEGKYLRQGIMQMMKNPIKSVKYAQATNYLCYWKSKGFSDYRVSMGMKEIITGYNTKLQEAQEIAGKPAGIADDITWAAMYFAAENKIKATTDLDTNSQEYRAAVDELFSEIINQTQVIDSTLRTTQTMRSKNDFEYLANAFKKEPQKSYNMLHRAAFNVKQAETPEKKNAADKEFRKTLSVFMLTSLVNGMVVAAVQAWRDDDDDNYLKKWLKKLTPYGAYESIKTAFEDGKLTDKEIEPLLRGIWGGMGTAADNADILSAIPLVAEFDSFLKGYSPSTLNYTSILTEANKTINSVFSATSTPYNALYSLSALTDYITGLGVSNAMRDIRGIWNQTTRVTGLPRIEKSTKAEADAKKNKNMDALVDAINNAAITTDRASAKADIYAAVDAIYQYKYDTYINDKENPKTPEEAEKNAKTQTKSSITSQFKPEYKQLVADKKYSEATTLEKNLIYAYGRLGYKVSHDDFTDWLKE